MFRDMAPWFLFAVFLLATAPAPAHDYCAWGRSADRVEQPLCGLAGDPARGFAVARDAAAGNCLACHRIPDCEEPFQGTIGPPLAGVGARLDAAQLRLRLIDMRELNPYSIMPAFYRQPGRFVRPAAQYAGYTFLDAGQVEDLVAWLKSLR